MDAQKNTAQREKSLQNGLAYVLQSTVSLGVIAHAGVIRPPWRERQPMSYGVVLPLGVSVATESGQPKRSGLEWIKTFASHHLSAAIVLVTMYALTRRLGGRSDIKF